MKALFIVHAEHRCTLFSRFTLFVILLLLFAGCAPAETAVEVADSCQCEPTSGLVTDNASDGSKAEVEVDTCMEPRPCNPQNLNVTSYVDGSTRLTVQMENELRDKGTVYALLDIAPDGKNWDPAIKITVVLNKPAPRDNFALSILRWSVSGSRWQKEGTAIADKKGDRRAEGEISHTSLFAFVDETEEEAVEPEEPEEERVAVPDVVGWQLSEARQRLREENFDVSPERRSNADVEEGAVIRTQPRAGSEVDSGSTVTLIVSSGPDEPETVRVPDIIGLSGSDAEEMLQDSGLFVSGSRSEESNEEEDTVLEANPRVGTEVEVDSGIFLVLAVSVPIPLVEVPDLIGSPLDQAIRTLSDYDLAVRREIAVESSAPEGDVIDMDPGPGAEVDAGTAVTLYYAVPEPCHVPDVIGTYLDEATSILNDTGCLYAGEQIGVESSESEWIVLDMDPGPGWQVEPDTAVTLYYATPAECSVPDVIGTYEDEAGQILAEAGCTIGETVEVEAPYPYDQVDRVVETQPAAGSVIDSGSAVNLFVARQPVIEQNPQSDYNEGYDMGVFAEGLGAYSATILYDGGSVFSTDRLDGFYAGFSEMGGEIMSTIPLNSDWQAVLVTSFAAGEQPDVIYFPVQAESADYIVEVVSQLNEEFGLEVMLLDAYGMR